MHIRPPLRARKSCLSTRRVPLPDEQPRDRNPPPLAERGGESLRRDVSARAPALAITGNECQDVDVRAHDNANDNLGEQADEVASAAFLPGGDERP